VFKRIDCVRPESMGHMVGERKVERRRLSVYFLYLAWRLWKSVVTLAVTGNTVSGRVFRRYRVTVFQRHRHALTGVDVTYGW
jgi:uncharacterized membrane protein